MVCKCTWVRSTIVRCFTGALKPSPPLDPPLPPFYKLTSCGRIKWCYGSSLTATAEFEFPGGATRSKSEFLGKRGRRVSFAAGWHNNCSSLPVKVTMPQVRGREGGEDQSRQVLIRVGRTISECLNTNTCSQMKECSKVMSRKIENAFLFGPFLLSLNFDVGKKREQQQLITKCERAALAHMRKLFGFFLTDSQEDN